jgi:hypothetical protein
MQPIDPAMSYYKECEQYRVTIQPNQQPQFLPMYTIVQGLLLDDPVVCNQTGDHVLNPSCHLQTLTSATSQVRRRV